MFRTKIIHEADDLTPYKIADLTRTLDLDFSTKSEPKKKTEFFKVNEGGRNSAIASAAGTCLHKKQSLDETMAFCLTLGKEYNPPLTDDEIKDTVNSIYRTHQKNITEFPTLITDMRVAEYFATKFNHLVRYWPDIKKWLIFNGQRWDTGTPGGAFTYIKEMLSDMYGTVRQISDDNQRQNTLKGIIALESHRRQEIVLAAASNVPSMIVKSSELDCDPMVLNCYDGTIDLTTGKIRPHSSADFITKLVNIDYQPGAECPKFIKFLNKVFAGNIALIDYLQRFIGYCLTGKTTEQVLLFLYGTGANGKTTLVNIIELLLGDFAATADSSLLMQRDNRSASNDLAGLRGARLVKVSEFNDGERLAEATIKTLTGGDRIPCRFLYGEFFEYTPNYKIILIGNYKPKVRGRDHGIWRRIHLLPFNVTISESERDPQLMDKLTSELPGVLAWAVRGCLEWQRIGLQPPAEVKKEVEAYRDSEDIFSQWIDECCMQGDEHRASAKELIASFIEFSGWRNLSSTRFGRMMAESGFIKEKSGVVRWRGLALDSGQFGQLDPFSVNLPSNSSHEGFTKKALNYPNCPKNEIPELDWN